MELRRARNQGMMEMGQLRWTLEPSKGKEKAEKEKAEKEKAEKEKANANPIKVTQATNQQQWNQPWQAQTSQI